MSLVKILSTLGCVACLLVFTDAADPIVLLPSPTLRIAVVRKTFFIICGPFFVVPAPESRLLFLSQGQIPDFTASDVFQHPDQLQYALAGLPLNSGFSVLQSKCCEVSPVLTHSVFAIL